MAAGSSRKTVRVTVFGGSGFLGSRMVEAFAAQGGEVRVATRHPDRAGQRHPAPENGNVLPVYGDVRDETSVASAIEGCGAVVNAVGLYVERGAATFEAVHVEGAGNVARQCREHGIESLIHISGIGADSASGSKFVRSRARGEQRVMEALPGATIFRPSIMFGPKDKFLNPLADMIRRAPVLPLFGHGQTRLQPAYVRDVADAAVKATRKTAAQGKVFELGGPRTYSYRELVELLSREIGRRPLLVPVPFPVWQAMASAASILPNPPITTDQVTLMQNDNVAAEAAPSFKDLGGAPTPLEDVLPRYGFSRHGR